MVRHLRIGTWLEVHPDNYSPEQLAANLRNIEYGPVVAIEQGKLTKYPTIRCKDGSTLTVAEDQFRKTRRRYSTEQEAR